MSVTPLLRQEENNDGVVYSRLYIETETKVTILQMKFSDLFIMKIVVF